MREHCQWWLTQITVSDFLSTFLDLAFAQLLLVSQYQCIIPYSPPFHLLYQLGEYSSIYQTRFFNKEKNKTKSKGSGVCLYIYNSFNFKKLDSVSVCKDHIETLFVKITSSSEPTVIGVVYRPPNCNLEHFNKEYERILDELNGSSVYILGDFNIDILKNPTELEDSFQEILYSNGLTPTISLPTHQMPGCAKTYI